MIKNSSFFIIHIHRRNYYYTYKLANKKNILKFVY